MREKRMSADNIPFEIQVEVMQRLPVKSLVVFRSVSKAWKSVIDSPFFVTNFRHHHHHHRLFVNVSPNCNKLETKCVSIVDDNRTLSEHEFETVSNVTLVPLHVFVGTSQGLLCVSDCYEETVVIWNPSLRKSIAIDVPPRKKSVLGFGVRPDNCDPVIVLIMYVELEHRLQVMLFTLSSRVWRPPRGGNLPSNWCSFTYSSPVATTDNRCIYWKAFDRGINLVVAFDMVSEDFMEINLPHIVAHRPYCDVSISKLKDSLTLLEYYDDAAEKKAYGVWIMDDVSKSFTKLFTINIPDTSLYTKVLGFRKNGQPIMETTIDGLSASLEVYEPRTGTIDCLGINGEPCSFSLSSYTETLLLLDQLDGQFVKCQLQL